MLSANARQYIYKRKTKNMQVCILLIFLMYIYITMHGSKNVKLGSTVHSY
jgi:hypothetical protein